MIRRLIADRRGVATVEFALVLPVILAAQFALGEFMQAYQAQRRVSHVAAAMADITAQNRTVSDAELDEIMEAGLTIIRPFPTDGLGRRISSLSANSTGAVTVHWSLNRGYPSGTPPSVPAGYLAPGESVVVTDVAYDYRPDFGLFLAGGFRFERHAYVRPRLSDRVTRR